MIVYGLKACDRCRKAVKALEGAVLHDVRDDGMPGAVLGAAYERFGADLVNTRSTTWRGLDPAERAEDGLVLLRRHPALMKRPLIESEGRLHLGWNDEVRKALAE